MPPPWGIPSLANLGPRFGGAHFLSARRSYNDFYRHAGPITTDRLFGSNTHRDFIGNGGRPSLLTERPEGKAPDRRFTLHHARGGRGRSFPQSHNRQPPIAASRASSPCCMAMIAAIAASRLGNTQREWFANVQ
jgi:hypothetical protein